MRTLLYCIYCNPAGKNIALEGWRLVLTLLASKINNDFNPPIMDFMFERRSNTYNIRKFQEFATKRKKNYRNESFLQLWLILLENLK